jgi:hypothetical protein
MKRFGLLLLLASLVLLLAALPGTSALMRSVADRTPGALLASDEDAALGLTGFHADSYELAETYRPAGSITNRFREPLQLAIRLEPTVTAACKWINPADKCVPGKWQLELCLSPAPQTDGTECRGQALPFGGSDQSRWLSLPHPTGPNQSVYLSVRGDVDPDIKGEALLCAYADFTLVGHGVDGYGFSGQSVQVSSAPGALRRQIYRMGSDCP